MPSPETLGAALGRHGISRRSFLKYCTALASVMALPPAAAAAMAKALEQARRPSVIYLSFQECTGCLESITRSFSPTIEDLIFNAISFDYNDTLQAAAGTAAEAAREKAMQDNYGHYILMVDGSVALGADGAYSTSAGASNLQTLNKAAQGAAAIICVGTCASFGGIPYAHPNPTGAVPVSEVIKDRPIVNVSGCPPIPVVITGTVAYYVTYGRLPDLDPLNRPRAFFGDTIHDRCYRRPFYDQGKFAKTFDDEGARNGWCLYELGCRGPVTYNACATVKWNQGTSFPIESGHPCLGCSEPNFWDRGSFYAALSYGQPGPVSALGLAAAAGAAIGAGAAMAARKHQAAVKEKSS